MLTDTLREGAHGKIFKVLFWIIILSFVFAGVGNYLIPRLNTDPVKVGQFSITQTNWTEQFNQRTRMMQSIYGPQAAELLENKDYVRALRREVLERMVDNVAMNSAVWESGIRIGDDEVKDEIRKDSAFQKDGKFDNDLFLATVRNMGASPDYYAEQLRVSILSRSVMEPVSRVFAVPMPYEVNALANMFAQTRTVDLYTLDTKKIADSIKVSDSEIQSFYDNHKNQFMTKATSRFNYIALSVDELKKDIKPELEKVEEYYNLHQDEFTAPEKREVAHILIKNGDDQQSKIDAVKKALAEGKSFAEVAEKYSDDSATAKEGGIMGQYAKGELSEQLDAAVFALAKVGDYTDCITDSNGAHFLSLNGIVASTVPAFKDVKDKAIESYTYAEAVKAYNDKIQTLTDVSYENPDSLDATAKALGLTIADSGVITYGQEGLKWPLSEKSVQDAAFAEANRTSGTNSPAINISDTQAAVINVTQYKEAELKPFDQVKDDAAQLALNDKTAQEANKILEDFSKKLVSDSNAAVPEGVEVSKDVLLERASKKVSPEFAMSIFAMPKDLNKATAIGSNDGKPTLALLKAVGIDSSTNMENYENLIKSQMVQYEVAKAQQMLYVGARKISTVEYNEDAIKLVEQQDMNN